MAQINYTVLVSSEKEAIEKIAGQKQPGKWCHSTCRMFLLASSRHSTAWRARTLNQWKHEPTRATGTFAMAQSPLIERVRQLERTMQQGTASFSSKLNLLAKTHDKPSGVLNIDTICCIERRHRWRRLASLNRSGNLPNN